MKSDQPFETRAHLLSGKGSIDLYEKKDLNTLSTKLIPLYNPDRFDAFALRLYVKKSAAIVTLFAVDTFKQEQQHYPHDKLPVKKFKISISLDEFFRKIKQFDVTLTNDSYDLSNILVVRK